MPGGLEVEPLPFEPTSEQIAEWTAPVLEHLSQATCYSFMPDSSRCVVLDIDLPLTAAFAAASDNDVTYAVLWDSHKTALCGMLTVTDYARILLTYFACPHIPGASPPEVLSLLDNLTIRQWIYEWHTRGSRFPANPIRAPGSPTHAPREHSPRLPLPYSSPVRDDSPSALPVVTNSDSAVPSGSPAGDTTAQPDDAKRSSPSAAHAPTSITPTDAAVGARAASPTKPVKHDDSRASPLAPSYDSAATRGCPDLSGVGGGGGGDVDAFDARGGSEAPGGPPGDTGLVGVGAIPYRARVFIGVAANTSALDALGLMRRHRINRVPVTAPDDATRILHVVSYTQILTSVAARFANADLPLLRCTLKQLGLVTRDVITAPAWTPLGELLMVLIERHVSGVPIVSSDSPRRVIDVFSRYDILHLAVSSAYNVSLPYAHLAAARPRTPLYTCGEDDTLHSVLAHFARTGVRRLLVVDANGELEGIVAASDVAGLLLEYAKGASNHND